MTSAISFVTRRQSALELLRADSHGRHVRDDVRDIRCAASDERSAVPLDGPQEVGDALLLVERRQVELDRARSDQFTYGLTEPFDSAIA